MSLNLTKCLPLKQKEISMKKFLLAFVFLMNGTAFASTDAKAIYNALNVEEQIYLQHEFTLNIKNQQVV
jgi:hypothetical protein